MIFALYSRNVDIVADGPGFPDIDPVLQLSLRVLGTMMEPSLVVVDMTLVPYSFSVNRMIALIVYTSQQQVLIEISWADVRIHCSTK